MSRGMLVNIVINDFTNDSRVLKSSKSLSELGYDVKVVAMHNQGLPETEQENGFAVQRIKLVSRGWSKQKFVQIVKYLEFVVRAFFTCFKSNALHCNDLNALPIGVLIKIFRFGSPRLVYDAHEYETELKDLKGIEKTLKKILERFLIPFADEVITVSNSISDEYARIYNIKKPKVVLNCPYYINEQRHDVFRKELGIREDQVIFLYQGGLSKGRGIEILLESFKKSSNHKHVLVCMGYGPLEDLVREEADKHPSIYFYPAVSPQVLLTYTSSADFGILFYEDVCLNHRFCSPNKMFEYLMAGIPVIASNLFEMKRLVEKYEVGVVAVRNDPEGFGLAVQKAMAADYDLLTKNVSTVRKQFCWEEQQKILQEAYIGS